MTPHPHKALIDAITSGAAAEVRGTNEWGEAHDANHAIEHGAAWGWNAVRLKPADTHREKTVRYPVPMHVMPKLNTEIWLVGIDTVGKTYWSGNPFLRGYLSAGLCYEIHREAEAKEAWTARFGKGWK